MRLAGTEMLSSLPSFPSVGQSALICDIREHLSRDSSGVGGSAVFRFNASII